MMLRSIYGTVVVVWVYIVVMFYLLSPTVFLLIRDRNTSNKSGFVSRIIRLFFTEQRLKYFMIFSPAILFMIICTLFFNEFVFTYSEQIFGEFVSSIGSSAVAYDLFVDVLIFVALLLFPLSTILIALVWYLSKKHSRPRILVLALAIWLITRICFIGVFFIGRVPEFFDNPLVPQINVTPGLRYYIPGSVFGGFVGFIVCIAICLLSILISLPFTRRQRVEIKYLTFAVCLSPIISLIFVAFKITFGFFTIDFAITALVLGWIISATLKRENVSSVDISEGTAQNRSLYGISDRVKVEKRFQLRLPHVNSLSILSAISRIGKFVLVAIMPVILLRWTFHDILGFIPDGSVGSWITIWSVALGLGLATFAVTRFYDRRDRALQVATVAFLCAFAIMIHIPINPVSNNPIDNIFFWSIIALGFLSYTTTIILALGTLALIATVVLGKLNWSWPFWACYLFIYIFVHSMAGSGYVNDLSKLDLFSWINMSVIVFVFLFAIPIYFASDRCQRQPLAKTHDEPPR